MAPFVLAILPLAISGYIIAASWTENYGNDRADFVHSLVPGFEVLKADWSITALGLSQSLFEGSMYTFIFMWTPALHSTSRLSSSSSHSIPPNSSSSVSQFTPPPTILRVDPEDNTSQFLGLVFAVFMMCSMVGSSIFQLFAEKKDLVFMMPAFIHLAAMAAMLTVATCLEDKITVYCMFLVFEVTVGLFYPCFGLIKSEKIPEESRSAIMNIFRIPLNAFVIVLLCKIESLSFETIFLVCAAAHFVGLVCYLYFYFYQSQSFDHASLSEKVNRQLESTALLGE